MNLFFLYAQEKYVDLIPSKEFVLYRDLHNTKKLMLVMTLVQLGVLL